MMSDDPSKSHSECDEALHELYHLLDGELTDDRRARILTHLQFCAPCAKPYDFYADLRKVVQERCRETTPPELLARVQAAISQESG